MDRLPEEFVVVLGRVHLSGHFARVNFVEGEIGHLSRNEHLSVALRDLQRRIAI